MFLPVRGFLFGLYTQQTQKEEVHVFVFQLTPTGHPAALLLLLCIQKRKELFLRFFFIKRKEKKTGETHPPSNGVKLPLGHTSFPIFA